MEKERLFNVLIEAIKNTKKEYYTRFDASLLERPFCYEFYHQFRLLQKQDCLRSNSLMLSGEPSKTLSYSIAGYYPKSEEEKVRVYPDFILHKSLDDKTADNQIMAIEVKQKGNIDRDKLESDIKKLLGFIKKLEFNFGVFIAIGMNNKELSDILKKTDKSICKCSDEIYFIATESVNDGEKKYLSHSDMYQYT